MMSPYYQHNIVVVVVLISLFLPFTKAINERKAIRTQRTFTASFPPLSAPLVAASITIKYTI